MLEPSASRQAVRSHKRLASIQKLCVRGGQGASKTAPILLAGHGRRRVVWRGAALDGAAPAGCAPGVAILCAGWAGDTQQQQPERPHPKGPLAHGAGQAKRNPSSSLTLRWRPDSSLSNKLSRHTRCPARCSPAARWLAVAGPSQGRPPQPRARARRPFSSQDQEPAGVRRTVHGAASAAPRPCSRRRLRSAQLGPRPAKASRRLHHGRRSADEAGEGRGRCHGGGQAQKRGVRVQETAEPAK